MMNSERGVQQMSGEPGHACRDGETKVNADLAIIILRQLLPIPMRKSKMLT